MTPYGVPGCEKPIWLVWRFHLMQFNFHTYSCKLDDKTPFYSLTINSCTCNRKWERQYLKLQIPNKNNGLYAF